MITDDIRIKNSKVGLVIGIVFFTLALGLLIILLGVFSEDDSSLVGQILSCILAPGFFVMLGSVGINDYIRNGRRMRLVLSRYGELNIINHIRSNTIGVFQKNQYSDKVYFTDRFVAQPNQAIIEYGEIIWMYKYVRNNNGFVKTYLTFGLLDGSKHYLCSNADDNDIRGIVQTCMRYNPNIVVGYSRETEQRFKENVKRVKNGMLPISNAPISSAEMIRSNNYENGKSRMKLGGTILGGELLITGILSIGFGVTSSDIWPIMLLIIAVPGIIVGVSLMVSGYDKMSKFKK